MNYEELYQIIYTAGLSEPIRPNALLSDLLRAEGTFNKLYSICSPHHPQYYITRITLRFFNTESECATHAYIRSYTSIPVPYVIAYSSSSENPLGFEWMLSEKIEAVP